MVLCGAWCVMSSHIQVSRTPVVERRKTDYHRLIHAAIRLLPAGPPEIHAEVFCRSRKADENMRQRWRAWREASANKLNSPKVHRRDGYLATVQTRPVMFTLLAEHLPSCSSPAKCLSPAGPPKARALFFLPQAQAA
jgi:hypothetical protein